MLRAEEIVFPREEQLITQYQMGHPESIHISSTVQTVKAVVMNVGISMYMHVCM